MSISIYTVAAICGNFWGESSVNPGIFEGTAEFTPADLVDNNFYGGYGLGQWTNKIEWNLTRRTELVEWLRENGYADDDGWGQIAYLLYENYWVKNVGTYNTLTDFLENTSTDIDNLVYIWMRNWEGIYNSSIKKRRTFANDVAAYISNHYDDPEITTWHSKNDWLSRQEAFENSVLVYRALTGGAPPKPVHKKMPLWMYLRRL